MISLHIILVPFFTAGMWSCWCKKNLLHNIVCNCQIVKLQRQQFTCKTGVGLGGCVPLSARFLFVEIPFKSLSKFAENCGVCSCVFCVFFVWQQIYFVGGWFIFSSVDSVTGVLLAFPNLKQFIFKLYCSVVVGWPGGSPACLPQRPGHGSQVSNINNTSQVFHILQVSILANPYQSLPIIFNSYQSLSCIWYSGIHQCQSLSILINLHQSFLFDIWYSGQSCHSCCWEESRKL